MRYYLLRSFRDGEVRSVIALNDKGAMFVSKFTELITQAEYETYRIFGIPEAEIASDGLVIRL